MAKASGQEIPTLAGFVHGCEEVVVEALAARVESHVGDRGLSGFVARAVEHELERDLFAEYLDELDVEFGVVPQGMVERFDKLWPS